jgi:aryl-alcohol dehydrogenase-like predicted oxidoreductase
MGSDILLRQLGNTGFTVPSPGLGCVGMSHKYGPADEGESIAAIQHAIDIGVTFLDTADFYGMGHNESLIGRALGERRAEVSLATKFGNTQSPIDPKKIVVDARPERAATCCDASLRRLNTDVIDLYYLHNVDPTVPIEESVGAMADLVERGKVRYLGLCGANLSDLERACAVHPIAALQSEWSMWSRDIERSVLDTARRLGIGIVPYSPLGKGFLTGRVLSSDFGENDPRRNDPRFSQENLPRNNVALEALRHMAAARGCSPGQLALAWLMGKGDDVVPIPGTKRREHLDDNAGARSVVLSEADMKALDDIANGLTMADAG